MRQNYLVRPILRWAAGFGIAAGALSVSAFAGDPACTAPAACATAPGCNAAPAPACCDKQYEAAGAKMNAAYNNLLGQCCTTQPGCNAPADSTCASPGAADGCTAAAGEEEKDEPWTLMSCFDDDCGNNWVKDHGTKIAGWFDFGYQSDPDGAFTGNGPFLDDKEWDRFNLSQMYIYAEKIADGSCGCGFGYRADLIYGTDGNDAQSFGNNPGRWDFANGFDHGIYEWAIPQLYGEIAYDKLSVKVGHFYTPIGYEVVPSTGNFFYSRQITFYNSEPFTHTGALANYKASDKVTVMAGYALGWDTGFDRLNDGSMGLAGVTIAASEKTSLIYAAGFGNFGWRDDGIINSFILTQTWTDEISTAHQFDVLDTSADTDFNADGVAGDSIGFINYAFYKLTDKAKAGVRGEWYKADGTSYYTVTAGLNLQAHKNVLVRPEIRHLWAPGVQDGAAGTIANNVDRVYGNNTVLGIDAIVTF